MLARARILALSCLLFGSACASLDVSPTSEGTGTFQSRALAFTFMGFDFPQAAVLVARANASDAQLPNMVVTEERIFPYFWKFDFLLDLISLRWASVSGTYGPAN